MTTQFPLSGPLTVGDLLDRAFNLYRARFGIFLLTAALFWAPHVVIFLLFGNEPFFISFSTLWSYSAGAIGTLALTVLSIEALHGRPLTTWAGVRRGLHRFWPYVGMTIVMLAAITAATSVAAIPFVIGLIALGLLFGDAPFNVIGWITGVGAIDTSTLPDMIGLIICGIVPLLILLLAPAVYLFARWFAALPALLVEETGPIESLRRSWHLGAGNVRRIVGYVLLIVLLVVILPLVIEMALEWIIEVVLPGGASELLLRYPGLFLQLLIVIAVPFFNAAAVLLYYDLRIRNEGYDLELRVAELEAQTARPAGQDAP